MSEARTPAEAKPLRIFISAVTDEFRADRDALAGMLKQYGVVDVQTDHPSSLSNGPAIMRAIDHADLVVCMVGHQYGRELPPGSRPPHAQPDSSWTQWEYDYAHEAVRAAPTTKRLVVFFDKGAPPGGVDERQKLFRERIYPAEISKKDFGDPFFEPYVGARSLARTMREVVEDPDGPLPRVQYSYWLRVRDAYRKHCVDLWTNKWALRSDTSAMTFEVATNAEHAPYIETRAFTILKPDQSGRQCRFLTPDAFLTGRSSNKELNARKGASWIPLSPDAAPASGGICSDGDKIVDALRQRNADAVVLGTVNVPTPIRLFIISGSGIGKTTSLAWLEARLNGLHAPPADDAAKPGRTAILLKAGNLKDAKATTLAKKIAEHVFEKLESEAEEWQERACRVGIGRDLKEGNLVLIIDGLDHISRDLPLLVDSQNAKKREDHWTTCAIVAAGRPQALRRWTDFVGTDRPACAPWRFLEPAEFSEDEARTYLGQLDGMSRYDAVAEHLGDLSRVPRILEYVRNIPDPEQLRNIRTSADIYFAAMTYLIGRGLEQSAAQDARENTEDANERVMMLLSALGFISLCRTVDVTKPIESDDFRMLLEPERKKRLRLRVQAAGYKKLSEQGLERDLKIIGSLASVAGNAILEDISARQPATFDSIMWANRTVQQFFAALWLSRYAEGGQAVQTLLQDQSRSAPADTDDLRYPNHDAQRSRHYVYFPESDIPTIDWKGIQESIPGFPNIVHSDTTYEFNRFLAEMPRTAIRKPTSWVAAASAWYDPILFAGQARSMRIWSTEMLYRSWPTMMFFADRVLDDWWDVPYEKLSATAPGRSRVSLHRSADHTGEVEAKRLAKTVLGLFLSDFDRIRLSGNAAATEMIRKEQWVRVPAEARFMMGTKEDAPQGVPTGKVDAYWQTELLDPVQIGRADRSPEAAAKYGTWKEWFAGAVGERGFNEDVKWLIGVFEPLAAEGRERRLSKPDRDSPAYRTAREEIEARFKTHDETPVENPQRVAEFHLNKYPVLHRWYGLFAAGHKNAVQAYLAELEYLTKIEDVCRRLDAVPTYPGDDHPVIYTTWYDAWAFCQWATWRDTDAGKRYGLRLPHEPEWEFAARWYEHDGTATQSPREWRWWWGDRFYKDESSPTPEIPDDPRAHADGRPGKTRAPADATPNGIGLHDMLGNVWEWSANLYNERETLVSDQNRSAPQYSRHYPRARPPVNGQRAMRGGLWYYLSILTTCANRFRYVCNDRDFKIGFRVMREERGD